MESLSADTVDTIGYFVRKHYNKHVVRTLLFYAHCIEVTRHGKSLDNIAFRLGMAGPCNKLIDRCYDEIHQLPDGDYKGTKIIPFLTALRQAGVDTSDLTSIQTFFSFNAILTETARRADFNHRCFYPYNYLPIVSNELIASIFALDTSGARLLALMNSSSSSSNVVIPPGASFARDPFVVGVGMR